MWRCVGEACIAHKDYLLAVVAYRKAIAALSATVEEEQSAQPTMHRKIEAQMHQRLSVALWRSGDSTAAAAAAEQAINIYPAIARARAQSKAWATPTDVSAGSTASVGDAVVWLAPEDLSDLLSPRSAEAAAAGDRNRATGPAAFANDVRGSEDGAGKRAKQLSHPSTASRMQLPPIQRCTTE